ncbi:MAG: polysaccharide pyruvyl transferase family protein [Pseudomonadota bacterium]
MTSPAPIGLLGLPGRIPEPERFSHGEQLDLLNKNSGNLLFQYGATVLFDAKIRHIGRACYRYVDPAGLQGASHLIAPASNFLRLKADWAALAHYFEHCPKPVVVLGLGAQSPKLEGENETIAALKSDRSVMRLVAALREKSVFISVRGTYTQRVCAELGLPDTEPLGCPSAMIHPTADLGRRIADRLHIARGKGRNAEFAIAAASPYEAKREPEKLTLDQKLFEWAAKAQAPYIQQSGGDVIHRAWSGLGGDLAQAEWRSLKNVLAPALALEEFQSQLHRCGRFYHDVFAWMDDLARLDVVIGTRVHGIMAGLGAGTPGALIAHDSRTGELTETMQLPQIPFDDAQTAKSPAALISQVRFNGAAFDQWRQKTATRYVAVFEALGLSPSSHLRGVAGVPDKAAGADCA